MICRCGSATAVTWCGFPLDAFAFWLHDKGRSAQSLRSCCSRTRWCFEDYPTMHSIMNINGPQRHGSQESYILDNTPKKKSSLWYRASLRGSSERHRQNTVSQPKVCKVRQYVKCAVNTQNQITFKCYLCCALTNNLPAANSSSLQLAKELLIASMLSDI